MNYKTVRESLTARPGTLALVFGALSAVQDWCSAVALFFAVYWACNTCSGVCLRAKRRFDTDNHERECIEKANERAREKKARRERKRKRKLERGKAKQGRSS